MKTIVTCAIAISCLVLYSACQPSQTDQNQTQVVQDSVKLWLDFTPTSGANNGKKIVLVSGDEEYRSEEMLPQLAHILSAHHGFDCKVLFAQDPELPGTVNPNYLRNIPGLEALEEADLMILFVRFRALPDQQMQHIQNYLLKGRPLIGIRTATHAFNFKDTTSQWFHWGNYFEDPENAWDGGFGRLVLGERWHTHHGHHKHQSTRGLIAPEAAQHSITKGLDNTSIWGPTDVYGVRLPLPHDAEHIIMGQVVDRAGAYDENDPFFGLKPSDSQVASVNPASQEPYNPNEPMMPIAWLKSYQLPQGQIGQAFTSTIGASTDFTNEGVRRLLVNASFYLLGLEVPAQAQVDLVGTYQPSAYNFHDDAYWQQKALKIADLSP